MSTNQQILQTLNALPPQQLSDLDVENLLGPDDIKDLPMQDVMPVAHPANAILPIAEDQSAQDDFDIA